MNKSQSYIAVLAMLPLFAAGLSVGHAPFAEAANPDICGVQMCSDVAGGREAWEEQRNKGVPVAQPQDTDKTDKDNMEKMDKDKMSKDHMDKDRMDKDMEKMDKDKMSKDHMDKDKMSKDNMEKSMGSELRLSRANVPATIPLHMGYFGGDEVHFIITDSSDPTHADIITEAQGWKVELAPLLANAPVEALSKTYMFTNGIQGGGVHGFQGEVFTTTPSQEGYSALTSHVHVAWNADATARMLTSEEMILEAETAGEITLIDLKVVLNMPHIVWPDGQMLVKEDKTLAHDTKYGGGQVLEINTDEMTVTFVAHRGWGPDGRTIYYIVTDATPSGPAEGMGVVSTPTSASLIANSAAVDLFQFKSGIKGPGPLGFQPGIAAGAPGDANYSPMWRISLADWVYPENAELVETIADLNAYVEEGKIKASLARPMDSDHIVNCPFIDPFQ
ncbi:MAG: hypothetical protein EB828_05595 [Nitrosopumilus sp. D6]|nr:MAG: hypothetical protein EB828_05595 [Nitrosopumilus sp. D6]